MKKILILLFASIIIAGCNSSGVVSERTVKQALAIVTSETKNLQWTGRASDKFSLLMIKEYLQVPHYQQDMECGVLDMSDVEGKKMIRACLLRGVNNSDSLFISSKDVLVMAEQNSAHKDIVVLMFFSNAEKTDKGFSYSTILPLGVAVNLKTQKIGEL